MYKTTTGKLCFMPISKASTVLQSLPSYTRVSVEGIVDTVSNVDIISIQQLTSSISIQYNLKHYFLFS